MVLKRFHEKGLTLNLEKCVFCQESLEFYGYIFSKEGMKVDPKKIEAIKSKYTNSGRRKSSTKFSWTDKLLKNINTAL